MMYRRSSLRALEDFAKIKAEYFKDSDPGQRNAGWKMPKPETLSGAKKPNKRMEQRPDEGASINKPQISAQFAFARNVFGPVMETKGPPIEVAEHARSIFFEEAPKSREMMVID